MSKDINFNNIVPRLGSQRDAFEELCCQLNISDSESIASALTEPRLRRD